MNAPWITEVDHSPFRQAGPYHADDFLRYEGEECGELLHGRMIVSPGASFQHQVVVQLLAELLGRVALENGGVATIAPFDVVLSESTVVQPDVLYIAKENLPGLEAKLFRGAPDLVVEVLSPGSHRRDRVEKLHRYEQAGVRELWLVDIEERQIDFLVRGEAGFVVRLPDDDAYRSAVLPPFRVELAELCRAKHVLDAAKIAVERGNAALRPKDRGPSNEAPHQFTYWDSWDRRRLPEPPT